MNNKTILGHILMSVGTQLIDENSSLCRSIVLSNEQMGALLKLLKVASSPQTHVLYIGDLAMRYGVTDRTIRNWIHDGVIPQGKKHDSGDNREYWLSHTLHKIDENLISRGYCSPKKYKDIDKRLMDLLGNFA